MNVLQQPILVLNRHWQPINCDCTVESGIKDMLGRYGPSKLAMHVELEPDGEGGYRLGSGTRPCEWEEWITLEVRNDHHEDRVLHTKDMTFRGPCVMICADYDKVPEKRLRWSTGNVRVRDNGICQVTGARLSRSEGNVAHDVAVACGGKDTWENTVYVKKELNTLMGTRTFAEMGWKLLRKPKAPPAVPASVMIREAKHVQWLPFLLARD